METIDILKQTDLFYNLTPEQLQQVATLAVARSAAMDEEIIAEGSDGRDVFVVVAGSVEVSHRNYARAEQGRGQGGQHQDNSPVVLATLSKGQSFGEIAFIDKAVREATVTSRSSETRLLVIDADALMQACEASPALGFVIFRNIARDLAFIIREMDVHMLGELYSPPPFGTTAGQFGSDIDFDDNDENAGDNAMGDAVDDGSATSRQQA